MLVISSIVLTMLFKKPIFNIFPTSVSSGVPSSISGSPNMLLAIRKIVVLPVPESEWMKFITAPFCPVNFSSGAPNPASAPNACTSSPSLPYREKTFFQFSKDPLGWKYGTILTIALAGGLWYVSVAFISLSPTINTLSLSAHPNCDLIICALFAC